MAGKIFVFILMILAIQSCGDIDKQSDDALESIIDFPEYIDSLNLNGQDFNVHRMQAARIGVKLIDTFDFGNQQLDLNCVHFYDEYDFSFPDAHRIFPLNNESVQILVDTSYKIVSSFRWIGVRFRMSKEDSLKYFSDHNKVPQRPETSTKYYNHYPVYIINKTDSSISFLYQSNSKLQSILEAQDSSNIWRAIEYWKPNWCGNTYRNLDLQTKSYILSQVKVYEGNFETKLRLKVLVQDRFYYSMPFSGSINYSQFDVPENLQDLYSNEKLFLNYYAR